MSLTNNTKTKEQVKEAVDKAVKFASEYVIDGKSIRETLKDQREEAEAKSAEINLAKDVQTKDIESEKVVESTSSYTPSANIEKEAEEQADTYDGPDIG